MLSIYIIINLTAAIVCGPLTVDNPPGPNRGCTATPALTLSVSSSQEEAEASLDSGAKVWKIEALPFSVNAVVKETITTFNVKTEPVVISAGLVPTPE